MCLAFPAISALANTFGPWGDDSVRLYYNESNYQRYFYGFTNDQWTDAINFTRWNNINPTHMWTHKVEEHDNSDVAVYVKAMGASFPFGRADCLDTFDWSDQWNRYLKCHHWHVTYNTDKGPWTQSEKDHLACHETGHTTGLQHYPDNPDTTSCLGGSNTYYFNGHDEGHINDYYANNPDG
jgi:hypothetical protein